ncbi:MAG: protein kinase [Rhizobacter sp.]|nr:protein kinase [Rhizobacter sp.]
MTLANWTTRFFADGGGGRVEPTVGPVPFGAGGAIDDEPTLAFLPNPDTDDEPTLMPLPDSLVGGRVGPYLITKRLGAGGVGEVFKATDVMLNREVAVKVLRDDLAADPAFLARFRNEARLQAQLSHPNVASVHAFLEESNHPLMVMEYVPGITLEDFVRSGGPVPVERALHMFRGVLEGVDQAHRQGIVHRDLKPANLMLTDSGAVKVMDFGIARALDSHEHLTRHGHVAGTAKVMSPEQVRGQRADVRSDIYSLGIVLYTLLAGRPPFDASSDLALMRAQVEQAPPPLRGLVADLPPGVEAAVMRALEKDPAARFQGAREFAAAIELCLGNMGSALPPGQDGEGVQAESNTVVNPVVHGLSQVPAAGDGPAGQPRLRRWLGLGAGAVALGAIVATLAWLGSQWSTSGEPPLAQVAPPAPGTATAEMSAASVLPARSIVISRLADSGAVDTAMRNLQPGEKVRLRVTTSHDVHVYCYLQDEANRIVRFFPNRFRGHALVKAGEPLDLPGPMRFELLANAQKIPETIACFAGDRDPGGLLPVTVVGTDFEPLSVASIDEVQRAFVQVSAGALAEARFGIAFD